MKMFHLKTLDNNLLLLHLLPTILCKQTIWQRENQMRKDVVSWLNLNFAYCDQIGKVSSCQTGSQGYWMQLESYFFISNLYCLFVDM